MYKYDPIIDNKTTINISNLNYNNYTYELPLSFYLKYQKELSEIRNIIELFNGLSKELIISILYPRMNMYDIYDEVILMYSSINETWNINELLNNISSITNVDMKCILSDIFTIIRIFKYLYLDRVDYLNDLYKRLNIMLKELNHNNKIINKDNNLIELPNTWYITKEGIIYNSMGFINGHKESNLIYPLNDISSSLLSGKNIDDKRKEYLEEYQKIDEDKYITDKEFWHYLHLLGKLNTLYDNRIYNPLIIKLVKGIIIAHYDLYDAFSKFNEIKDKELSYKELIRITNNSYDDLFVRFLGMSKVNVSGTKAICTIDRDTYKFNEYLDNNHYLDFVNPIEVKDGIIQERNLSDFDSIRKVLK